MYLTLQYPVAGINTTENATTLKKRVFSPIRISTFQPSAGINYLQSNVIFLRKMSLFSNFFAQ